MHAHELDIPELIKDLDGTAALIRDSSISDNLKADLRDKSLVYACFLTDLSDGKFTLMDDGVPEMIEAARGFTGLLRKELTIQ